MLRIIAFLVLFHFATESSRCGFPSVCALSLPTPLTPWKTHQSAKPSLNVDTHRTIVWNRHKLLSNLFGGALFFAVTALPVNAQVNDPSVYNNNYSDPFHPLCNRRIEVSKDGKTFHYSGTDVGPKGDPVLRGCSKDEIRDFKLRFGSFDGYILDNGRLSVGDNVHEGVWEPAGSASTTLGYEDQDGIRWNDGNKWIVQKKPLSTKIGEVVTFSYIGFSLLAGANELLKRALAKK